MNKMMRRLDLPEEINKTTGMIVESSYQVHRRLGPGLLEIVYEMCLVDELTRNGLRCQRQVELPVQYRDKTLDCALRLDLIVEDQVIVEIKAVEKVSPLHEAQLMTYLKLSGRPVGFLINFNVSMISQGIHRMVLTKK